MTCNLIPFIASYTWHLGSLIILFQLQVMKIPIRNSANGVLGIEITYLYYMYHIICTIYMYHIICAKYYILKCQNMRLFEPKKAIVIVD